MYFILQVRTFCVTGVCLCPSAPERRTKRCEAALLNLLKTPHLLPSINTIPLSYHALYQLPLLTLFHSSLHPHFYLPQPLFLHPILFRYST